MLRLHPKLIGKLLSISARQTNRRHFSSQGSSKLKFPLIIGAGTVAAATLTLAYAKYDKEFADELYTYAPFVKNFLEDDNTTIKPKLVEDDLIKIPKKEIVKPLESSPIPVSKPVSEKKPEPQKSENKVESFKLSEFESPSSREKESILKLDEKDLKKEVEKSLLQKEEKRHELEDEFRGQLKRLIYAFNELYEEKRILYETENKRKQEIELKNHLVQERAAITEEYEKSFKKLKQMEKLLQIRDQLDKQEKAGKKLWLLSQTLAKLLEYNPSMDKEVKPIEIQEKIEYIRNVVKEHFANEKLIQVALNSLSEEAIKNGVFTEEDLIRRYHKLHKICNRVALVSDEYTNIFGYLMSYAYSYVRPFKQMDFNFSLNPITIKEISQEELEGKLEVNPDEWDVYDIMARINLCVEHRNLEMALRYANLLSGEPYRVARDWIKDTREHLEVKQVLELMQTKIASINLHQLSFSS